MHFKSRIRNFTSAAVIGCAALLPVGAASARQPLAPTATLDVAPAIEVDAQENYVMEQPVPASEIPFRPTMDRSAYDAAKAAANLRASGAVKPFNAFAPLATPHIKVTNFNGHSSTEGLRPPDTEGAIGTSHFVEVTNSHIDMYTRNGVLAKSVTLAAFFGYSAQTLFDPRVVHDSIWKRWIVTADAFAESNTVQRFFIAVSKTDNPLGAYFVYNINVTFFTGDFWDFPQLGMDQDAALFTANIFNGNSFHGADFFSVAKARLYNGLGFSVPVYTGLVGTLAPPIVLDQNNETFLIAAPPSGTTLTVYDAEDTSKNTLLFDTPNVTVNAYNVPPSAPQPGTPVTLDTSDSRFVNASTQNGNDLWQTHTIADGTATPFFYRIDTSAFTVTQSGIYYAGGASSDFNTSITANAAGDCFVTYSSTDAATNTNAQVRLSGKLNADASIAPGPVAFTSTTFYAPTGVSPERWGDYSAVTLDPASSSTAWLVNEQVNTSLLWGSHIVKLGY